MFCFCFCFFVVVVVFVYRIVSSASLSFITLGCLKSRRGEWGLPYKTGGCSSEIFEKHPKRYQNLI